MTPKKKPEGLDKPFVRTIIKYMSRANTAIYRATGGRVGKTWRIGAGMKSKPPICLLTTIGRKSGQARTVPLVYLADGEDVVVVASQGGRPENPMWFGNIVANTAVDIEIGRTKRAYKAHAADATERAALWPRLVALYADFESYQSWTEREIPVVICSPA